MEPGRNVLAAPFFLSHADNECKPSLSFGRIFPAAYKISSSTFQADSGIFQPPSKISNENSKKRDSIICYLCIEKLAEPFFFFFMSIIIGKCATNIQIAGIVTLIMGVPKKEDSLSDWEDSLILSAFLAC